MTSQAIFKHAGIAGHFQIELDRDGLPQDAQVALLDVAAVFAEVERDAVRAAQFGQRRCPDGVWLEGPPRLADGGYVVNIDAEFGHYGINSASAGIASKNRASKSAA